MSDDDITGSNNGSKDDDQDFIFEDEEEFEIPDIPDDEELDDDELGLDELDDTESDEPETNTIDVEMDENDVDDEGNSDLAEQSSGTKAGMGWKSYAAVGSVMVGFVVVAMFSLGLVGGGSQQSSSVASAPPVSDRSDEPTPTGNEASEQTGAAKVSDIEAFPDDDPESAQVNSGNTEQIEPEPRTSDQPGQMISTLDGLESTLNDNNDRLDSLGKVMGNTNVQINRGFSSLGGRIGSVNNNLDQIRAMLEQLNRNQQETDSMIRDINNQKADSGSQTSNASNANESQPIKPSETVRNAQSRLDDLGYNPGPVDGYYGELTNAGVKRFQKAHGMEVTGELDQPTLDRIMSERAQANQSDPNPSLNIGTRPGASQQWFVRGVTNTRAILYTRNGGSYIVKKGTEVPGKGQVARLVPSQHKVILVGGETIRRN